jgi:hypothetical protein
MEVNAMPNDQTPNEVRDFWQSQTKEASNVSLDLIRYKARQLEVAMRQQVVGVFVVALVIVAACLFISWWVDQVSIRIGAGVLILWALYLSYQVRKGVWPGRLAPDATLAACVGFYRKELERQRSQLRAPGKIVWPVLLSVALFLAPAVMQKSESLARMAPFLTMIAAWAVIVFVLQIRKLRAVQREVDELGRLQQGR